MRILTATLLLALTAAIEAQTPAAPTPPRQPGTAARTPARQPAPAARRLALAVQVTDSVGKTLEGITVSASGPAAREAVTDANGQVRLLNLAAGTYRLRFEGPDFITFEREVVLRAGQPAEVSVSLTAAPPKPTPPPPEPPPPPPPAPSPRAAGEVKVISLPDIAERNMIDRREPQKTLGLGMTAGAEAILLQVREPMPEHTHAESDEMIYVIAGQGLIRMGGRNYPLDAGWLAVIPRATPHTIERTGRNPMIALSIQTVGGD